MHLRFTNTAILILVIVLSLTGGYGIIWTLNGWVMELHRIAGWSLIALIPWKAAISWRSLKRGLGRRPDRNIVVGISIVLAIATLAALAFSVMWAWRIGPDVLWLYQTTVSWHWIASLILLAPLLIHVWRRWPRPQAQDFTSRRAIIRMTGLGIAGLAGWWIAGRVAAIRVAPEHPRRVTGSREHGSGGGNSFPITGELAPEVSLETWRLTLEGRGQSPLRLTYSDLLTMPCSEWVATLDCTMGWYSVQSWQGIRLYDLLNVAHLAPGARAVRLKSVTGYSQVFSLIEARHILLATHVGEEQLDRWHGYPLRAVVPYRRGWFWVKWLAEVTVLVDPGDPLSSATGMIP